MRACDLGGCLLAALCVVLLATPVLAGTGGFLQRLTAPCRMDCAVAVYAGNYVQTSLGRALVTSPEFPIAWDYQNDHIVAIAASRTVSEWWSRVTVEPEVGIAQRYGDQDETEVWGAFFFRYHGFPWDKWLVTTAAISTGLNYATDISEKEQDRARDGQGSKLMHFFAPEITFAAPSNPDVQLLFRFHHRSGVFGLVSDAFGGAQYGTVGLRLRF